MRLIKYILLLTLFVSFADAQVMRRRISGAATPDTVYLRPISTVSAGQWSGGYADIDEAVANDADYIQFLNDCSCSGSDNEFVTGLTDVSAENLDETWTYTFVFRGQASASGGIASLYLVDATNGDYILYDGPDMQTSFTTMSAGVDANGINNHVTDWSTLKVKIVAVFGSEGQTSEVSQLYIMAVK